MVMQKLSTIITTNCWFKLSLIQLHVHEKIRIIALIIHGQYLTHLLFHRKIWFGYGFNNPETNNVRTNDIS